MKHENDVSNAVWLSPSCENLQFHKWIKEHIRAWYIVFVKTENNNFIKEINYVLRGEKNMWKT